MNGEPVTKAGRAVYVLIGCAVYQFYVRPRVSTAWRTHNMWGLVASAAFLGPPLIFAGLCGFNAVRGVWPVTLPLKWRAALEPPQPSSRWGYALHAFNLTVEVFFLWQLLFAATLWSCSQSGS